ncbi:MAG: hypothetical protein M1429_02425 [Patescibacteria group bacterium]|nr:hypothetical protein [Patescibacteria group bacterium]
MKRLVLLVVLLVVVIIVVITITGDKGSTRRTYPEPQATLNAFLKGWQERDHQISGPALYFYDPHQLLGKIRLSDLGFSSKYKYKITELRYISEDHVSASIFLGDVDSGEKNHAAHADLQKLEGSWQVTNIDEYAREEECFLKLWYRILTEPRFLEEQLLYRCQNNVKQLGCALVQYCDSNNGAFPSSNNLEKTVGIYVHDKRVFHCPLNFNRKGYSYSLNLELVGKNLNNFPDFCYTKAIFECDKNGRDVVFRHQLQGKRVSVYGCADSHVELAF